MEVKCSHFVFTFSFTITPMELKFFLSTHRITLRYCCLNLERRGMMVIRPMSTIQKLKHILMMKDPAVHLVESFMKSHELVRLFSDKWSAELGVRPMRNRVCFMSEQSKNYPLQRGAQESYRRSRVFRKHPTGECFLSVLLKCILSC